MAHRNIICTQPQFMDQGPLQIHPSTSLVDLTYHSIYGTNTNTANQFSFVPTCQQLMNVNNIGPSSFYAPSMVPSPRSCRFVPVPVPPPVPLCPVGPTRSVPVSNQTVLIEETESETGSDKSKDEEELTTEGALYLRQNNGMNHHTGPGEITGLFGRVMGGMSNLVPQTVQNGGYVHPAYVNQPYQQTQWGYVNALNTMGPIDMGNPCPYFPQQMVQSIPVPHPLDQIQSVQMQVPPYAPHPMMAPHGAILGRPSGVVHLGPRIPSFHLPFHTNLNHRGVRIIPSENARFMDISRLTEMGNAIDEHIDMRLDIDGMSYEELLDLEERMGDVNTGLSEGVISKKLKTHFHIDAKESEQDEPCIICQVEFEARELVGTLDCGHMYHSDCIKQWLKLKNLCPICKKVALSAR